MQRKNKFILLDRLQPGDIVLSGGTTPTSMTVQLATGSRFAHAAIVIDPLIWFEAIGEGTQFLLPKARLVVANGQLCCAHEITPNQWVRIVRPKQLAELDLEALATYAVLLADSTHAFFERDYPRAEGFLNILKFRLGNNRVVERIARRLSKGMPQYFPGPFCSQLAVECLRTAGVSVFDGRPADSISARAIGRSKDFVKVEKCIWRESKSQVPKAFEWLQKFLALHRDSHQSILDSIHSNRSLRHLVASVLHGGAQLDRAVEKMKGTSTQTAGSDLPIDMSQEVPVANPIRLELASVVGWWTQFRAAQRCSQSCQASDPTWKCDGLGCKLVSKAFSNRNQLVAAAFKPLVAELESLTELMAENNAETEQALEA